MFPESSHLTIRTLTRRYGLAGVLSGSHDYPVRHIRSGFFGPSGAPLVVTADPEAPALCVWDVQSGTCVHKLRYSAGDDGEGRGASNVTIVAVTARLADPLHPEARDQRLCAVTSDGIATVEWPDMSS